MQPEDTDKKWGTIYMGGARESSLDKIDAMQAATRQEQWNQRTQAEYLERVRQRATERAREILGEAYMERQKVLDEAKEEAQNILREAQEQRTNVDKTLAQAEKIQTEAETVRAEAQQKFEQAQSEGFDTGLAQARDELDAFRAAMGDSVAAVLAGIHRQCSGVFDAWREEIVELTRVCVEKATGWVLGGQHAAVLESLVMEAVRQLEDRRVVTLHVHPDDEAAVADMFAAARERMSGVGQWIVAGDPSVTPGGLIAEGNSGTVDSRLELHEELVTHVLRQLVLPPGDVEEAAAQTVEQIVQAEAEKIAAMAPPVPEAPQAFLPPDPEPEAPVLAAPPEAPQSVPEPPAAPAFSEEEPAYQDIPTPQGMEDVETALRKAEQFAAEFAAAHPPSPVGREAVSDAPLPFSPGGDPSLAELEQELLPLPPDRGAGGAGGHRNPPHVDAVLAEGGFLSAPGDEGRS